MKWPEEAERFLLRLNITSPRPEMRVTSVESAPLIDLPAGGGNKSMSGDAAEIVAPPALLTPGTKTNREDGPMSQEDTFADIPFADEEDQSKEASLAQQRTLLENEETGEPSCHDESLQNGTPANDGDADELAETADDGVAGGCETQEDGISSVPEPEQDVEESALESSNAEESVDQTNGLETEHSELPESCENEPVSEENQPKCVETEPVSVETEPARVGSEPECVETETVSVEIEIVGVDSELEWVETKLIDCDGEISEDKCLGVEDCLEEERPVTEGSSGDESGEYPISKKDEYAEDGEVVGSGLSDDDDSSDDDDDYCHPPTILVSPPNPPKGILKKTPSEGRKGRRIVFNEMMTVFSDNCPEMQVPAFRPWDLTYSEMCFMYEPPPEYQDWLPFDPPAEYQDSEGFAPLWSRRQILASAFCPNGRPDTGESEREMCTDFSEMEDDETADSTVTSESFPTDEVAATDLNDNFDKADDPNANRTTMPDRTPSLDEDDVTAVQNDTSEENTSEVSDDPSCENTTEAIPFADFQDESKGLDLDFVMTSSMDGDLLRTNSQIRKNIEINALRRSLLRGADIRRRNAGKRPKSPTVSLSSLEEKLRWLTATDDEDDTTASETLVNSTNPPLNDAVAPHVVQTTETAPQMANPVSSEPVPIPNCVPRKPQRWASEVLYRTPPINKQQQQQPPTNPQYFQPRNNKQPPSRPSSFDPSMGRMAWEALFQREERLIHGSTLSLRNPYPRTTERHPNAASRPQNLQDRQGTWTPDNASRVVAFRKSDGRVPTSDELECFVQQDLERIERIKKRYSLTEDDDPTFGFGRRPSVRGIRPRFGSTTEILKQLQSQMQPPSLASPKNIGSHVTWPYPDVLKRTPAQPSPQQQQQHYHHHRSVVVLPQVNEEENVIHHHRSTQCLRFVDPRRTKDTLSPCAGAPPPPPSKNSLSVVTKDERGTPEGASSSPKVSSDSLYHHHHHHQQQHPVNSASPPKEAVIYYSMNV